MKTLTLNFTKMKKLLLAVALLAGMTFVACSSDDDGGSNNNNSNCVTCDSYEILGQTVPEMEICEGENGNAFIDGEDTGEDFDTYVSGYEMLTDCN